MRDVREGEAMSGARKDGAGSTDAPSKALRMAEAAAEVGEDLGIEAPRTGDASPGPYGRAGSAFDEDNVPMPRTSDVRHSSTCIAGISPGADCTCTEGLYTQTSRTPEGTGDTPRDENEAVLARTAASGGIIGPPDLSEPRTETATAERLEISRRAHQADRERLAALQREIGPLRAAARAVVRECIDGGVDNAVLDRLVKVDLVAALGDERVRPTATAETCEHGYYTLEALLTTASIAKEKALHDVAIALGLHPSTGEGVSIKDIVEHVSWLEKRAGSPR
jgi:hypothetical protein